MTEDNFTIRKASPADLPRIHGIYAAARQFMRDHGNFSQWDGEDAPEHLLPGDIEAGNLYVLEENGVIHAAFAFIIGADPCYAVIEQGAWKADTPYAAVHRVASDGTVHNILGRIMDFAKSKISHIRIDTHERGGELVCRIRNSCFPKTASDRSGSGIGLKNLSKRLEMIYPQRHTFEYGERGGTYTASLRIKLHER